MSREKSIAVLIPCYNEEKAICKVIADFKKQLPSAVIYVFDNNSTDRSVSKAKKTGAVIRRVFRRGKGNVVRAMFHDVEADIYVLVDGDDTYDASDVHKMINAVVDDDADMVIGDRLNSTYFKENKRFGHGFGNVLVRKIINISFHSDIQDVMTGYRVFSRRFVKTCPILANGFQVETEMTMHALDKKMSIATVPVGYRDRSADNPSKLNTYIDGIKVMSMIFNMIKEYRPLMFFSILSLVLFAVALILGIPVFADFLATGLVARFPTLIVAGMLVILSFLAFVAGLILDTITRKSRQQFEIDLNIVSK